MDLAGVREERREERETLQKMRETDPLPFYVGLQTGSGHTRPTLACCRPLDLDPIGSGSIQRPRGVLEIRIHLCLGLGFLPAGFWFSFSFLNFSCYVHPCVCYLDLLCVLTSLQNSKKNCYAFLVYLWLFRDILHVKIDKNLAGANFSLDWDILCFL